MQEQNTQLTPERVIRTYENAKERRRLWESHWTFSCWNSNDPNREKIIAMGSGHKVFDTCVRIARRAISGCLNDETSGATHYHTLNVNPPWSRGRPASAEIGRHLFYNDIE